MESVFRSVGQLVFATFLGFLLFACGESEDKTLVTTLDVGERTFITINSVVENIDQTVTIHFSAANEDVALIGLSEPRISLAKLVPEQDGKPSEWVSFINTAVTGNGPTNTKVTLLQATYDSDLENSEGRFTDNGNGTYHFKLKEKVLSAVNPITRASIPWDARATHRVGMRINIPENGNVNATYDWVPLGGQIIDTRNMIDSDKCDTCHADLEFHGSTVDPKYCVTCHNPSSRDPESSNSLDFTPMIHKIHRGALLPSMLAKGDGAVYEIICKKGPHTYAKNNAGDITGVGLPQDIRNCSSCHSADSEITAQGDNWKRNAGIVACTSCHDDIAFSQAEIDTDLNIAGQPWKKAHSNGFVEADSCASCHNANAGDMSPTYVHETVLQQAKSAEDLLTINFVRVERVATGLKVDVQINYGGTGIADFASFSSTYLSSGHGYLLVNADEGAGYTKSDGIVQFSLSDPEICVPNGSGLYTCTITQNTGTDDSPVWASLITETGTLSLMTSDINLCVNGKSTNPELIDCLSEKTAFIQVETVPAKHVEAFYDLGDGITFSVLADKTDYVEKIGADIIRCKNCHADDDLHITSHPHAATELAQCTNCHNATRSAVYAGSPADLKSNIHALHTNNDSSHSMGTYPKNVVTCTLCHTENQYDLPLVMNTRSSAGGGVYTSPIVTVCASCHIVDMPVGLITADGAMDITRKALLSTDDIAVNQKAIGHMLKHGGAFGQLDMAAADAAPELCANCHAKGEVKGVDTVHGL
ncbi:MAG: OmcA/MtrC family decaheme c-type cytochrome [Psychromonas sp.]|jgi:OmcA/MtrC family decaheme c-type cytochrome|uniref:OmcA/MtrC family decaheme c-type cytochrome n=1 Tax=Psychromonas sp. TaxID=1884585 RepID=UPI0039E58D2A